MAESGGCAPMRLFLDAALDAAASPHADAFDFNVALQDAVK